MDGRNKIILIAAIGAVAILVVSSAIRCTAVRTSDDGDGRQQAAVEQEMQNESGAADPADDGAGSIMSVLESHAWQADGDASKTVAFKDGRFVESDGKDTRVTACDVTRAGDPRPGRRRKEADGHLALRRGGALPCLVRRIRDVALIRAGERR